MIIPENCERCNKKTNTIKCSWFNTQMICSECSDTENKHEKIKLAKDTELEEVKKGNMNYEGIGLPDDLAELYK